MEVFGIIGMSMGTMGFIFSINALSKVSELEKKLQNAGVLGDKSTSE